MLRNTLWCLLLLIITLSCDDKESEETLDLKGTMKGKVMLYTETGRLEDSQAGATVMLTDGKTEIKTVTNDKGEYIIEKLPFGTYNVAIEKAGYATMSGYGFKFAGGEEPFYSSFALIRPSTTRVDALNVEVYGSMATFKGVITHPYSNDSYPFVGLVVFLSNTPDVSPQKYTQAYSPSFITTPSGTETEFGVYIDREKFPSGTTMYAVVYGRPAIFSTVFNPETRLYEYIGLSATPSRIVSVVIP